MARFYSRILFSVLVVIFAVPEVKGSEEEHERKVRKVLPLDHHLHPAHRDLQSQAGEKQQSADVGGNGGGQTGGNSYYSGNGASHDPKRQAQKGRNNGGGFLGGKFDTIDGRAGHGGIDSWKSYYGGSAPAPTDSRSEPQMPVMHPTSATHSPVAPSKSNGEEGKGKGKGKGSIKSKSKTKSKSKSKSKLVHEEDDSGGGSIGGGIGNENLYPSGDTSMDVRPTSRPPTEETVNLTPFGILYDLENGISTPTSEDYGMAIDVTVNFLNTYMSLQYEGQGLKDFQTVAIATIYRDGVPQIDFTAEATFNAADTPSLSQLDNNVEQAFSGANLALYINMLQNLPDNNGFSTVTGARLISPANMQRSSRSGMFESVSTVGKAGIAGAIGAGGLIIFAIGVMLYGNKKRRPGLSSERAKLTSIRQSRGHEATTCASSTDGSRTEDSSYHKSEEESERISIAGQKPPRVSRVAGTDGLESLSEIGLDDE